MTNTENPIKNQLKLRLAAGDVSLVMRIKMSRTVEIVGIAQAAGYHGIYIDMQHNTMSLDTASQICSAAVFAGITPLVRVPEIAPTMIGRLLDGGALGIIVPDVISADMAREAVNLCRMPPFGDRSIGGPIPLTGYQPLPGAQISQIVNDETMVLAQLESGDAIDQAEAIAAVDGIDALFIGSSDLTLSLGIPGQFTHEKTQDCFRRAIAAAHKNDKHMFIGGIADPEIAKIYVDMGAAPCFFPGADSQLLLKAAKEAGAAFNALAKSDPV